MTQSAEIYQIPVTEELAGERLDRFLSHSLPDLSRTRLKTLIIDGQVTCDGQPSDEPSQRVKAGQTFAIVVPESAPAEPLPQEIPLEILYEDDHLIVLNKPAGLVVHPAPGNPDRTLVNALLAHCGPSLTGIGGVRRPGIVHRLDKDTSGVMVAAKSAPAHQGLVEAFAARSIERRYDTVVWGVPNPPIGTITGNIGRSPHNRKKMAVLLRGGKAASTRYKVTKHLADGGACLLECRLDTGRTHQIRVHLNHIGHSVLGDSLYNRSGARQAARLGRPAHIALKNLERQALHASSLGFAHPITKEELYFETKLPREISRLIDSLEKLQAIDKS